MRKGPTVQLPDKATMTVAEAAALLRVDKGAAYAAVRRGELPAIRVGRAIRIPTAKLADLLGIPHRDVDPEEARRPAD